MEGINTTRLWRLEFVLISRLSSCCCQARGIRRCNTVHCSTMLCSAIYSSSAWSLRRCCTRQQMCDHCCISLLKRRGGLSQSQQDTGVPHARHGETAKVLQRGHLYTILLLADLNGLGSYGEDTACYLSSSILSIFFFCNYKINKKYNNNNNDNKK